jgi:hypothetical protein
MTTSQSIDGVPTKIGVLLYETSVEVDAIMTGAVERIRATGITVGGLLQRFGER